MSVLDSLPSNRPLALLREARQISHEIKTAQQRGSSSILMSRLQSDDAWDITVSGSGVVEILFTPDNMQFGGAFCYRVYGKSADQYDSRDLNQYEIKRKPNVGDEQRWLVPYVVSVPTQFKFFFFAQGSGTFTVKKL
ncbi:hypothetical protein KRR55_06025 [Paeniglutamicibacter sp. ABSL32-1]|uniref:hypothetical protein n=1 Tax=Paeniglutamicibacter quisquiliarum TaxID=2849498 RepID=UPI001C2CCCC1|nr:hypothetical protein [Paeniglutamicibacter quisquiliarum]MBV1778669.1 hypothetical protein [Paeniglutamicibacter quisquiliarum]